VAYYKAIFQHLPVRTEEAPEQPKPGSIWGKTLKSQVRIIGLWAEDRNTNQKEYYHPNREVCEKFCGSERVWRSLVSEKQLTIAATRFWVPEWERWVILNEQYAAGWEFEILLWVEKSSAMVGLSCSGWLYPDA
jgi:hypothetical protein